MLKINFPEKKVGILFPIGRWYVLDYYDTDGRRRRDTLPEGTTKKKTREALRDIEARVSNYTDPVRR